MAYKQNYGRGKHNSYSGLQNRGLISPIQNGETAEEKRRRLKKEAQAKAEAAAKAEQKQKEFTLLKPGEEGHDPSRATSEVKRTKTLNPEQIQWNIDNPDYFKNNPGVKPKSASEVGEAELVEYKYTDKPEEKPKPKKEELPTDPVNTYIEDPGVITGFTPNPRYDSMNVKGMKEQGIVKSFPIYAPKPQRRSQKGGEGEHLDVETSDVSGVGVLGQQKHDYEKPVEGETTQSANNPLQRKDLIRQMKRQSRRKKKGRIKGEGYDVLKGEF